MFFNHVHQAIALGVVKRIRLESFNDQNDAKNPNGQNDPHEYAAIIHKNSNILNKGGVGDGLIDGGSGCNLIKCLFHIISSRKMFLSRSNIDTSMNKLEEKGTLTFKSTY